MVTKTTGKKQRQQGISTLINQRSKRTTRKQRGGDDLAIEGIVDDIKSLNKKIAKPHTDGAKFKKELIDPFYTIVSLFNQHIGKDITKKDLTALSKSLENLSGDIEKHQSNLTRFYPESYSNSIPREISRMLETTRTKIESMPTIDVKPTIVKPPDVKPTIVKKNKTEKRESKKREEELEALKREEESLKREAEELEALKREEEELEALKREEEELEALKREALKREAEETLFMDFENTRSNKVAKFEKLATEKKIRIDKMKAKRQEKENKLEEGNKRKEETMQQFSEQFNNEISLLFKTFKHFFETQLKALHNPQTLVSIIETIYPNVAHYTDKIQNQIQNDKFLYKLFSFYLLIFIGMLNNFLKTRVPNLKLVIKGGKAAQMILSPNPNLELKSDDIDVLVQHPDQLYAKIFSQHFVSFFKDSVQDTEHISILLDNPTNPHVLKIYYINKDNNRVVISDIDSKPLPNPELFDIIETKKSKDIVFDADDVYTAYLFRLTYYHQTRESFINEKKYYRDLYSNVPPSHINSRFAKKASHYVSVMENTTPEKYGMFMPPAPPSSPK